jgi:predicted transcriptional regulator of viral defense system
MPAGTYRRRLWELALDQYGYVTTANAAKLGVPAVELRKLARRGNLDNVARGLYRFPDAPTSGRDAFMEAVLWVGPDAALSHDAVLALHDLASANPRTLRVVTPHRVRKTHQRPDVTIIHDRVPASDLTVYFRIPSTTVARALLDCRELVRTNRLLEAADEAVRQGLLLKREYEGIVKALRGVA